MDQPTSFQAEIELELTEVPLMYHRLLVYDSCF